MNNETPERIWVQDRPPVGRNPMVAPYLFRTPCTEYVRADKVAEFMAALEDDVRNCSFCRTNREIFKEYAHEGCRKCKRNAALLAKYKGEDES